MSARDWPPIIRAGRAPLATRVRDVLLTLAAWSLLAWGLRGAIVLAWDYFSHPLFELTAVAAPDWPRIWRVLAPFVGAAALLAMWLVALAFTRRGVLGHQQFAAQPPSLEIEAHTARYGLRAADVEALRGRRIVTVRVDADGRIHLA